MTVKSAGRVEAGRRQVGNLTNAGKGRVPGTPNKVTREIRAAARLIVERPEYVKSLKGRLDAGKAPHMETLLFHYAYGKPRETVALENSDGTPIHSIINHYVAPPPSAAPSAPAR